MTTSSRKIPLLPLVVMAVCCLPGARAAASIILNDAGAKCKLSQCEQWNVIVVPILRPDRVDYLQPLKDMLHVVLGDCKWYYGYLNVQILTHDLDLVRVTDPLEFSDLDDYTEKFLYEPEEQHNSYTRTLDAAIRFMPTWPHDFGRYILIVTTLDRNVSGAELDQLETWDAALAVKGIHLRTVRIEFDGRKTTQIDASHLVNIHRVRNISSNIVRVSLIETDVLTSTVKPCRALSAAEQMDHVRYSRHYQAQLWIEDNFKSSFIGAFLLVAAVVAAGTAYLYRVYESRRKRQRSFIDSLRA